MGYPTVQEEIMILGRTERYNPIANISEPVMNVNDVAAMQEEVKRIMVTDDVKAYIVNLVASTRQDRNVVLGISPRGSIALFKASRAFAYIYDRQYVTPDDVKHVAVSVLAHRIILSPQGKTAFGTGEAYIENLLRTCQVPAMIR